ncbi:RNA polymerase sigma factor [Aestuariimicrobium ganziense]|uniref:RNA polymerase sigma factor n=1 Tax=Aestuariimicrobium ganziense TaxID=2773677 RepID=UPI001942743B|nr:sigma-70 family RNA polymerase sigma factor [Aestuariimicrobium ganziense]
MGVDDVEQWYRDHGRALIAFAHLVAGEREMARDAVQEAMSRCLPHWPRIEPRGRLAYVKRAIVNHVSSARSRGPHLVLVDDPVSLQGSATDPDPADDALWALCRELPANQWAALVLRYHDDASYDAIAATLGCTTSTARSHVHRGLATLRKQLDHD